jgi:hypothetical protein
MAEIIAALIGAIAAVLVARFDDIADLIRGKARKAAGEWEGESYRVISKPDEPFDPQKQPRGSRLVDKYTVSIKQTGRRVQGVMTETHVVGDGRKLTLEWKGKVVGDYLIYECSCPDPERFLISTPLLFLHAGGDKMSGYFVANGGATTPSRAWVGFAELKRR